MATYLELSGIKEQAGWNDFLSKVRVAAAIKAAAVIDSTTPAVTVLEWAKQTVSSPAEAGNSLVNYIIAVNDGATVTQILSATDAAIQTNINSAVDAIYGV